jgi:hypothetical protein
VWCRDNRGVYNWDILDTKQIMENHLNHTTKRVYIPLVHELVKKDVQFKIDPYVIGAFIGDGCLTVNPVLESADEFIPQKIKNLLGENCSFSKKSNKNSKSSSYYFKNEKSSRPNPYRQAFSDLNLIGKKSYEKFIPEIYFHGSFRQRIALLNGLMDTDGTLSKSVGRSGKGHFGGSLEYSTTSEQLSKDVQRLVWSIGGKSKITTKKSFYKNENGDRIECRTCFRVKIKFRDPKSLFSLERKSKIAPDFNSYQYSDLKLKIIKIEKLPQKEDCRCIEIDDKEHLYVIDDYIVTHNTQFCLDFTSKVSEKYSVPVLHFDNGEMSKEELIFRQCAAMSGVPIYLLESGNWRKAGSEIVNKVRNVWGTLKERYKHLYYYNVGGMNVDSQISVLKRFYYSKIGRGKPLIFSFDYIKTTSENANNKTEWQVVGEMVDKYKKCIQRDIKSDSGPCIAMMTSVQSNRSGIVTNKVAANVVDDESIVSLSDRITQFSSHMFILRNKTFDELQSEKGFGTHKLINIKARHLGRDIAGAINPVKMPDDSLKKNFINLEIKNFSVAEKGDLRDIVNSLSTTATLSQDGTDDVPDMD